MWCDGDCCGGGGGGGRSGCLGHPYPHQRLASQYIHAKHWCDVSVSTGVFCMTKHPHRLSWMLSGACDGEVRLWDLATQECIHTADLHHGFVQGLCTTPSGDHFISVGQDKTIRVARLDDEHIAAPADEKEEAITLVSKNFFTGVDHHRKQDLFATSGPVVDLWSTARSEPITSFSWGADTVTTVKVPFHCTAPACLRTIRRSNVRPSLVLLAGDVLSHNERVPQPQSNPNSVQPSRSERAGHRGRRPQYCTVRCSCRHSHPEDHPRHANQRDLLESDGSL